MSTELYAILGHPIGHSLSPVIHNAAFKFYNMDSIFIPLSTDSKNIKTAIDMIRSFDNIKGYTVTMPLKEEIIFYLDELSPEARLIGAVNCVVKDGERLVGYNTDSIGFAEALKEVRPALPQSIVIFGSGGVAKAIAVQCALLGIQKIIISSIDNSNGMKLVERLNKIGGTKAIFIPWQNPIDQYLDNCGLVINATSLGMNNQGDLSTKIPWPKLNYQTVIHDVVYNPVETTFIKVAKNKGFETISGLELLINQGIVAFELWTKTKVEKYIMEEAVYSYKNRI